MIRVGITVGDIHGIGPEIVIKALSDKRITELCTPIIYANPKLLSFYKKGVKESDFFYSPISQISQLNPSKINLLNCWNDEVKFEPGNPEAPFGGKGAFLSLEAATRDIIDGKIDVLVTGPVDKSNIQKEGKADFKGHTEYLGEKCQANPVMIMVHEHLKVALITGHTALKDVSSSLKTQNIIDKINLVMAHLLLDFSIRKPKIAVLGLNPHNGDDGMFGEEEKNIILPAIEHFKNAGLPVMGPFPSDGFFASGNYKKFDAVIAMYHDQGLIPFKLIAGHEGVNYTMGLPIIRVSPDHGPAFDIAGKYTADESGIRNAIYTAIDIFKARKMNEGLNQNPLRILSPDQLNKLK